MKSAQKPKGPMSSSISIVIILVAIAVVTVVTGNATTDPSSAIASRSGEQEKHYLDTIQSIEFAMKSVPHDSVALSQAGETLKALGALDLAVDTFSSAITSTPYGFQKNFEAASVLQYVVYENDADDLEALEKSILHYDRALKAMWEETNLEPITPEEKIAILVDASRALKKKESNSIAIELLLKAFEIDSRNIQVTVDLYLAYIDERNFKKAKTFADHAVGLHPNVVHYRDDLGSIFKLMGDFKAAEEQWRIAVGLKEPISIPSLCNLGHLGEMQKVFKLELQSFI